MIKDSKQRLFEMMNRVGGMPLTEDKMGDSVLPPGFSASDFDSLENDVLDTPCEVKPNAESSEFGVNEDIKDFNPKTQPVTKGNYGISAREISPEEITKSFQSKAQSFLGRKKQGIGHAGRTHSTTLKDIGNMVNIATSAINPKTKMPYSLEDIGKKKIVVDRELLQFDLDKLKSILTTKPPDDVLLGQNSKMLRSNIYNISLPALKSLIYNEADNKWYVVQVCSKAGECINWCYAQMGNYVMFNPPIRLKMQKLNYIINHWEDWKNRIIQQIKLLDSQKSEGEETVVRWHDAGDFISMKYLEIAFDVAISTPKVFHYAYTKEVNMVKNAPNRPSNFEIKFSHSGKEDKDIGINDPNAIVAPEETFVQFLHKKPENVDPETWEETHGQWNFTKPEWNIIKNNLAEKYKLDVKNILSHDEYMATEHDRKNVGERRWYVVGKPGDTDIPASRKDTMGIINLLHK